MAMAGNQVRHSRTCSTRRRVILTSSPSQITVTADGVVLVTTSAFEPETTIALQDWYSKQLGKRLFLIGPQVYPDHPDSTTVVEAPAPVRPGSTAIVLNFLKNQAPGSVWFISFGTTYFPLQLPRLL